MGQPRPSWPGDFFRGSNFPRLWTLPEHQKNQTIKQRFGCHGGNVGPIGAQSGIVFPVEPDPNNLGVHGLAGIWSRC